MMMKFFKHLTEHWDRMTCFWLEVERGRVSNLVNGIWCLRSDYWGHPKHLYSDAVITAPILPVRANSVIRYEEALKDFWCIIRLKLGLGNSNKLLPVMLVKWKQWCYSLLLAGEGGGEGEETKQQLLPYIDVKYFAK